MRLRQAPSPNHGPRRDGARPDLLVLHYTAMADADAALARLCDPAAEVSAHYLVARDGTVIRLVQEAARAWHAGAGGWGAVGDVNSRSIGIEIDNDGSAPFAEPAMAALEELLAAVMARWQVPPERVIGHSDMAPGRKADPGRRFDWRRLARSKLSVWPEAGAAAADAAPEKGRFMAHAERFGYRAPAGCADPALPVLEAVRARFRPWATGAEDATDRALIADLARRFPVDPGRTGA